MSRRALIILAAIIVVAAGIMAMIPDNDQPGAAADHPSPATGQPKNPAAPAPGS
ncbi:hypothetical protein [Neorhizobium sp. SOG26]|jgi:hypothetical protein|uniref:hypothetical protein n=1 Tax=Neorhizobium sp. SOG26 TaxID=2060726 RepID=UPI001900F4DF|nr:hypothetical protein [Neorhizobium sp. SOG26]